MLRIMYFCLFWAAGTQLVAAQSTSTLTVAGGCFWCVEADFEKVDGVVSVVSGYTGGHMTNPTYRQVVRGNTGHYEAVQIVFQPEVVSQATLLHLFLRSIDPTDPRGQFCDRGSSYRSAIFADGSEEKKVAQDAIESAQQFLTKKIVTPILPLGPFYEAEAEHQDYYKSQSRIVTRFGIKTRAEAYKLYRTACGRDARVREIWGKEAAFQH